MCSSNRGVESSLEIVSMQPVAQLLIKGEQSRARGNSRENTPNAGPISDKGMSC